jgi:hypothetical protein
MRYRLRTLLIVLTLAPPLLAGGWWKFCEWRKQQHRREIERLYREGKIYLPSLPVVDPEA